MAKHSYATPKSFEPERTKAPAISRRIGPKNNPTVREVAKATNNRREVPVA